VFSDSSDGGFGRAKNGIRIYSYNPSNEDVKSEEFMAFPEAEQKFKSHV
jgi:hypothetical protein